MSFSRCAWMTTAYFQSVATLHGCPSMWLDDCVQEIELELWRCERRDRDVSKQAIKNTIIDFLRKTVRGRGRASRASGPPFYLSALDDLDPAEPQYQAVSRQLSVDPTPTLDYVLDHRQAIESGVGCTPRRREALLVYLRGERPTNAQTKHMNWYRQRLRAAVA